MNSVTLTKIKLPWITSNYKTMQRLKAKKRFQSPPPHPLLILDISLLQTCLKKLFVITKGGCGIQQNPQISKFSTLVDQRCCSQLLSPRLVLLLIQRTLKNFDNSFTEHLSQMSYFTNQITLQLEATHKNLNNILSSRKFGRQLHLYS